MYSAVVRTMATKSWILLVVACLLSDVIGKCIRITKQNANTENCAGLAEFDASKEHNIVGLVATIQLCLVAVICQKRVLFSRSEIFITS